VWGRQNRTRRRSSIDNTATVYALHAGLAALGRKMLCEVAAQRR
jgi:hypothetical protein